MQVMNKRQPVLGWQVAAILQHAILSIDENELYLYCKVALKAATSVLNLLFMHLNAWCPLPGAVGIARGRESTL